MAEVQFIDVTAAVGITFHHRNGAQGEKHPPETIGSGVAFLDYDGDGWLDLYFVNSAGPGALYRNNGGQGSAQWADGGEGTFEETTERAGVANSGYGMGCAAADYDNDGDTDLYITCYGPNILYRNNGDGTFSDVTALAGVGDPGFGTGAAFGDYDQDGDLDLYVANYIEYRPELNRWCTKVKGIRIYCGPEAFPTQPDVFYRNNGNGTFTDVTGVVGMLPNAAKEFGAVFTDYDNDGDPDLFVAGDGTPNLLYRNDHHRFTEVGALAGVAYSDDGKALAGMGVAAGDYDNDGLFDLFVTNFQWETNSLYRNLGNGFFADMSFPSGLGAPSLPFMGWGTAFFDYDNDGDRDVFVANGHLDKNFEMFERVTYAQKNQLFRNDGKSGSARRFVEVTDVAGPGLALKQVSRGSAVGDYDNDGDLDIVISNNNQPAALLRNDGGNRNHWIAVRLIGAGTPETASTPLRLTATSASQRRAPVVSFSNRDGIGARIKVVAGSLVQVDEVRNGSSYLSQHDFRVFFGLGAKNQVDLVEIRWPGGSLQRLSAVGVDQVLTVYEPRERSE
jgi:hypothetical protein